MRRDVTAALRLTLQGHLTLRKSRLESFCVLVVGVLLSRTVNLSHLACLFPTQAARVAASRSLRAWPIRARTLRRISGVTTGLRPLRRSQSGASPLPDEIALELAQGSQHVEHEPAARGRRVNLLG